MDDKKYMMNSFLMFRMCNPMENTTVEDLFSKRIPITSSKDLEVYLKFKTKLPNKHKKIIVKDLDEKGITMIHTIDGYIIFEVIKSYKELFYEISEILSTLLSLYTKERYDEEWINSIVNHDN